MSLPETARWEYDAQIVPGGMMCTVCACVHLRVHLRVRLRVLVHLRVRVVVSNQILLDSECEKRCTLQVSLRAPNGLK